MKSTRYRLGGEGRGEKLMDIIPISDLKEGEQRLLEVDNRAKVPVQTEVRLLVTGEDVLHSFAVPSLFLKVDAVPGRL